MASKIFLLGRPGSGKSTAARYIDLMTREYGWSSVHINDYEFLQAMYQADTQYQRFRPSVYGGFDVLDFSVLDIALQEVEARACHYMSFPKKLLLLEFARDNYQRALKQFQPGFLQDAYFLFFEATIDMCVRRVYERSSNPTSWNDHFISEQMIRSYYSDDNRPYLTYNLLADYGISDKRVRVINNTGSRPEFKEQIKSFVQTFLDHEDEGEECIEFRPGRSETETYHA
jgi:adenylate kinase family enzyme